MMRIAVVGASGRMGQCLIAATQLHDSTALTGAISRASSGSQGQDAGSMAGLVKNGIVVTDDLSAVLGNVDVVIDFNRCIDRFFYMCRLAYLFWLCITIINTINRDNHQYND